MSAPGGLGAGSWTVADLLRSSARRVPDRVALCWPGGACTYAELDLRTNRVANALTSLARRRGDRVAVLSEARREYAELHVACAKAGLTLVNLNSRSAADDLAGLIAEADPCAVVRGVDAELADAARAADPGSRRWLSFADLDDLATRASPADPRLDTDAEAIHSIVYTSGSTGRPKGVLISHRAAVARGLEKAATLLGPDDSYALALPMFHIGGDVPLYAAMLVGARVGILPSADPEPFFDLVAEAGLTVTTFVPAGVTLRRWAEHVRASGLRGLPLRAAEGQGDPVPGELLADLTGLLGVRYRDSYGMSELSTVLGRWTPPGEPPSLWKDAHLLTTLELLDDDGEVIDAREREVTGELAVRTPMAASGYLDRPDATAAAFADGWFRTGDVFTRDAGGGHRFRERRDDVIRSGGENVYPSAIEQVLRTAPGVADAVVVGVADPDWGRAAKAFVVPADGATVTVDDLATHCRTHLVALQRPRSYELVAADAIPRSPLGKVLRRELEARPADPSTRRNP